MMIHKNHISHWWITTYLFSLSLWYDSHNLLIFLVIRQVKFYLYHIISDKLHLAASSWCLDVLGHTSKHCHDASLSFCSSYINYSSLKQSCKLLVMWHTTARIPFQLWNLHKLLCAFILGFFNNNLYPK